MVHDTSHEPKSKHLSIHAWKAARSVSAHSWACPLRSLYLGSRTRSLSWNENWARKSNQGNTVHGNFVISGSCLRNRGYVSNAVHSSLRYNSMGPYTFPRDKTVAANYTHQLYSSLCPPRAVFLKLFQTKDHLANKKNLADHLTK